MDRFASQSLTAKYQVEKTIRRFEHVRHSANCGATPEPTIRNGSARRISLAILPDDAPPGPSIQDCTPTPGDLSTVLAASRRRAKFAPRPRLTTTFLRGPPGEPALVDGRSSAAFALSPPRRGNTERKRPAGFRSRGGPRACTAFPAIALAVFTGWRGAANPAPTTGPICSWFAPTP